MHLISGIILFVGLLSKTRLNSRFRSCYMLTYCRMLRMVGLKDPSILNETWSRQICHHDSSPLLASSQCLSRFLGDKDRYLLPKASDNIYSDWGWILTLLELENAAALGLPSFHRVEKGLVRQRKAADRTTMKPLSVNNLPLFSKTRKTPCLFSLNPALCRISLSEQRSARNL